MMFEQEVYDKEPFNAHVRKTHPHCHFCKGLHLYDQDALTKHYSTAHHFCELCKKLGLKKAFKSKNINMPDYEVYRDFEQLKIHQ